MATNQNENFYLAYIRRNNNFIVAVVVVVAVVFATALAYRWWRADAVARAGGSPSQQSVSSSFP